MLSSLLQGVCKAPRAGYIPQTQAVGRRAHARLRLRRVCALRKTRMRLHVQQIKTIKALTTSFLGNGCRTYLFGSRLNDGARGGDVDLLVETPTAVPLLAKARLKTALERNLSLPVDLIVVSKQQPVSSFVSMVRSQAVPLPERNEA